MSPSASDGIAPEILIITGMSGAGRSQAASALEDLGWFVVDNLPPSMIDPLVSLMAKSGSSVAKLAVVVDVRGGQYFAQLSDSLKQIYDSGVAYRIIFLDASDETLVKRYEQVRRPHPLQGSGRILDGIEEERRVLDSIKHRADEIIDTSNLSVNDLARQIRTAIAPEYNDKGVRVNIVTFGFKYGLPMDADWVADIRFMANPFWVEELRELTGHDGPVRDYVLSQPGAVEFVENYLKALEAALAGYLKEEKRFVTLAIGCTGGRHRSVAMAEEFAKRLRENGHSVTVTARDIGKR
ncbi:MAG: RNase adapter RapZ [Cellulomonadaceae bacterium]|jgi:UPF0042 nucleotide-binding protein|nr:RNase adapter RapZ [Cellulomonadaceae bacterium]